MAFYILHYSWFSSNGRLYCCEYPAIHTFFHTLVYYEIQRKPVKRACKKIIILVWNRNRWMFSTVFFRLKNTLSFKHGFSELYHLFLDAKYQFIKLQWHFSQENERNSRINCYPVFTWCVYFLNQSRSWFNWEIGKHFLHFNDIYTILEIWHTKHNTGEMQAVVCCI